MGEIYKNASTVLIWLGQGSSAEKRMLRLCRLQGAYQGLTQSGSFADAWGYCTGARGASATMGAMTAVLKTPDGAYRYAKAPMLTLLDYALTALERWEKFRTRSSGRRIWKLLAFESHTNQGTAWKTARTQWRRY